MPINWDLLSIPIICKTDYLLKYWYHLLWTCIKGNWNIITERTDVAMGKFDGRNSIQNRTMQAELAKCDEVRRKSIYTEIRKGNNLGID